MKSERRKTSLDMLMMAAATVFLAGCAMEVDGDEEAWAEQEAADELAPLLGDTELATDAVDSEESPPNLDDPTILVSCRRVTASSIPVYVAPDSNTVRCSFFAGDVFSHFGFVQAPGFSLRVVTWCPRGVPPSHPDARTSYARVSGTVDGGCG